MAKEGYSNVVRGSSEEVEARKQLLDLFKQSPIPDDEMLVNLGLYLRSTQVAKVLYLNELYERIVHLPGIIVEFGIWWGANLALLESFRSVYEPYNWTRKVVGFDTLKGYPSIAPKDGSSAYAKVGGYTVTEDYENYLRQMLDAHEADNVMAHIRKYDLVKGDVLETVDGYFTDNPETIVALAYFDLALYEPTKKCLQAIRPHLMRGSVIAMDELNSRDFPGETIALKEVIGIDKCEIVRSRFLPDRSYLIIE
ncbi:MAG TPA: TylF/MycF/NovP-related O-methyltransferase [Chthoniobacterales bacterium]|nr:TylF/MycF/NovP-related O-methyltransferase [Chthoniobacterales bacterium]